MPYKYNDTKLVKFPNSGGIGSVRLLSLKSLTLGHKHDLMLELLIQHLFPTDKNNWTKPHKDSNLRK
jgi:hypothetical protein